MKKIQLKCRSLHAARVTLAMCIALNTFSIARGATTVASWQGDKKGVVSITMDDGLKCQITSACPSLKQHGLKATFFIISSYLAANDPDYMDANDVLSLAAGSYEIGSHTVTHPDLTTLSDTDLVYELSQSQLYLQQLTGQKIDTIAYPYGDYDTTVINAARNYYIAARSVDSGILNSLTPDPNQFYRLYAGGPHDHYGAGDANAIAGLQYWVDQAVSSKKWYIELFHGIDTGYDEVSSQAFSTHLDYLVANEPNLWVAPMGEVSEYIYERNAAAITTLAQDSNSIQLNLHCGLDSRFTTPLTLLTDCPAGWSSQDIQVKQGQTSQFADVISKNGSLYIIYDAVPDAGTIELSISQVSPPTNYTITASAGSNGAINPSGSIQDTPGSSQLFTAAPNAGYAVDKWSLDGSNAQTGGTTFTLGNIQANHTVSVTFGMLPAAPASITYPATSSTGQYTVSWASSTGATSYQLERSSDNGSTWSQIYSGANTSYSENVGNGSYKYHVRATNAFGSSIWTTGSGNCVVTMPPQPPISISYPASSNTGQYTVQWSSSNGATSYQLARSSNGGTTWSQVYSGANTSYPQSVAKGSYRYRVRATNASGSSAWTTGSFDCVVVIPPPPAPASITYPASSNTGKYTVSWSASTGATSYQLQQSTDAGVTWTQVSSGANTSRSQNVANGSYRYRVCATNTNGSSGWTTGTFDCVVLTPPTAPTGVSASDGTFAGKIHVTWNASSTATSYEIWRNTSNKSNKASKIAEVTTLTYDDTSVTAGTTYWYWVKAKNSAGASGFGTGNSGWAM